MKGSLKRNNWMGHRPSKMIKALTSGLPKKMPS